MSGREAGIRQDHAIPCHEFVARWFRAPLQSAGCRRVDDVRLVGHPGETPRIEPGEIPKWAGVEAAAPAGVRVSGAGVVEFTIGDRGSWRGVRANSHRDAHPPRRRPAACSSHKRQEVHDHGSSGEQSRGLRSPVRGNLMEYSRRTSGERDHEVDQEIRIVPTSWSGDAPKYM